MCKGELISAAARGAARRRSSTTCTLPLDIEPEIRDRVIRINLTGCMLAARHAIPLMQKPGGGAMVHIQYPMPAR